MYKWTDNWVGLRIYGSLNIPLMFKLGSERYAFFVALVNTRADYKINLYEMMALVIIRLRLSRFLMFSWNCCDFGSHLKVTVIVWDRFPVMLWITFQSASHAISLYISTDLKSICLIKQTKCQSCFGRGSFGHLL